MIDNMDILTIRCYDACPMLSNVAQIHDRPVLYLITENSKACAELLSLKDNGPSVETSHVFLCVQNINHAEILAWKKKTFV